MAFKGFDRDKEFADILTGHNAHACLKGFVLENGRLSLRVMPYQGLDLDQNEEIVATFSDVRMQNFDVFTGVENKNLPWDIVGMNCLDHKDGLSFFCIHCFECEMVFLSRWPHIETGLKSRAKRH
ncbi:hypothetical protein [Kiloniella antarctica]|uniref:Uncharacterized protein n=1 Tax=Kiloniella antarctica TaxID=1550907 RepID=A0ABW5BJR0_9PROT